MKVILKAAKNLSTSDLVPGHVYRDQTGDILVGIDNVGCRWFTNETSYELMEVDVEILVRGSACPA